MASLGSAQHRGELVLSVFVMQPGQLATISRSGPFPTVSMQYFHVGFQPLPTVQVHVLLFSSDSIQITLNILSAIRDFPESYLNVNKSLMVYVKEGER